MGKDLPLLCMMLPTIFFSFSLIFFVCQVRALASGQGIHLGTLNGGEDSKEWSLDKFPNTNTTDHLIFDTVHSLLQHWPNTRMRNGHNIVPGTVPKGTLLYHGTYHNDIPTNPDWVSTDPEHAHYFCRDYGIKPNHLPLAKEPCWLLTMATTRPLRVLYFDGNSAAKLPYGTLDTQDLIVWGAPSSGRMSEDIPRIQGLCKWGKKFGLDGFVRMEMDFEVMVCDFTSRFSVVSFLNMEPPGGSLPSISSVAVFETMHAGSWHNHFPGETRIQLDLSGLVSFYDTQLVPSLVPIRAGQERWDHRAGNVSDEDLSAVKPRIETTLTRASDLSSGIDWKTLIRVIVDRFAERLELTRYLLSSPGTGPEDFIDLANKTHTQLRVMLTPYLQLSAFPPDPLNKTALDWAIPIYKHCATVHTSFIETLLGSMTESEKLIFRAIQGTSREICRVVTKMWAAGVYTGIDAKLNTKESLDVTEITQLRNAWVEGLNRLMIWLDWSVWVKCDPACGPMAMCYLPTWPVGFPRTPENRTPSIFDLGIPQETLSGFDLRYIIEAGISEEVRNTMGPEWVRPRPKCISRIDPYRY